MIIAETERLTLRLLTLDDAEFILELITDPSWLRFIGDKGVRTLEDARAYIETGPIAMYERHGFGLYVTERTSDGIPMGMCGLIKRDGLDDVDIGFAFLPRYWGRGYAFEAASAVMEHGRTVVGLDRIVAITSPDNEASARLLEKLGLRFDRMVRLTDNGKEDRLFTPSVETRRKEASMTAAHLVDLFRHMAWADAAVWTAVLASEHGREDARIRGYLHHLHVVQYAFLRVWRGEPRDAPYPEFDTTLTMLAWASAYPSEGIAQLETWTEAQVSEPMLIPWASMVERRIGRPPAASTLAETAMQVPMHSQYHRGQVNARLREVGGEPPLVDYIAWVWLGRPDADWPVPAM